MSFFIDKVVWNHVRQQVAAVNPEFAQEVDRLSPGSDLPLYRVSYPFGKMIYKDNKVILPQQQYAQELQAALSYRAIPMGLLLNRTAEIYNEIPDRVIPLRVLTAGDLFGFCEAFEPINSGYENIPWNISAGSRSTFSLAKLNDTAGLSRLMKRYQLRQYHINRPKDHWRLFQNVLQHKSKNNRWQCDVLFFPNEWFKRLHNDPAWFGFRHFCYKHIWKQTISMRHRVNQYLIWQQFSTNLTKRGLRCDPYLLHTLKHIFNLSMGVLPCFKPVIDDSSIPIHELHNILVEDYGLDYMPTIMQATHFNFNKSGSYGYYSINEPTLIESVVHTRKVNNIMQISREISQLLQLVNVEVKESNLDVSSTPMQDLLDVVKFDTFHNEFDPRGDLSITNEMPKQDISLVFCDNIRHIHLPFCYSSSFLRGCVRFGSESD